ncbi:MAG TPA: multicopper oxidase domain-containing protein [Candidatus Sulfotelmatobacter sp.]|nr:multicopper oxidase domain-containing protein [Candidatus Sulfotelmatobacter sp.]
MLFRLFSRALTRRALLLAGTAGLAAGVAFVQVAGQRTPPAQAAAAVSPPFASVPRFPNGRAAPPTLGAANVVSACQPGPERIAPGGHDVYVDLPLERVAARINNPTTQSTDDLELRTYSGCLTSPLLTVRPGDTLHVAVHNELSADDPTCGATPAPYLLLPVGVGCFNTTNLHTHGLHVSPSGISDNVLRSMPPRKAPYPVEIALPADHPAGTFWYHAHMHGSTAVGVSSADAGVLIVRGDRDWAHRAQNGGIVDVDTILHDAQHVPFPDTVFELQQIAYGCFWQPAATPPPAPGTTPAPTGPYDNLITTQGLYTTADTQSSSPPPSANAPWSCSYTSQQPGRITKGVVENFNSQLFSATIWDTNGRFTSINGIVQPTITVAAGAIQRWRFVHAGVHDTINVQVLRMSPALTANGGAPRASLLNALAGKTRVQQAAIVEQVCRATPSAVVPQVEIADDGLTRTHVNTIKLRAPGISQVVGPVASNYLQPGYRSDILVAFPSAGDYCLLDQAAPPGERVIVNPKTGATSGNGGNGPSIPQLLAYVHVAGGHPVTGDPATYILNAIAAANPDLPPAVRAGVRLGNLTPFAPFVALAPPHPQLLPKPTAYFGIDFNSQGPVIQPNGFGVNGIAYQPDSVQPALIRQLGTTDDWDVAIQETPQAEPHIFHIHINPFEIMDIQRVFHLKNGTTLKKSIFDPQTGQCTPLVVADAHHLADQYCSLYHVFRDTLFIEDGYDVTLRTHYARYTGEFVLHCHILDHEDAGMMANVEVVKDRLHPPPPGHMDMPMHGTPLKRQP